MIQHLIQTAADDATAQGAEAFWSTGAGKFLGAIFGAVGVLVVLVTVVKSFASIAQGGVAKAFKSVFAAIVLCVFLFRPSTINDLIALAGDLFTSVIDGIKQTKDSVDGGAVTSGPTPT